MPQRNNLAELGFGMVLAKARAVMDQANIPAKERRFIYGEAISYVSQVDGLTVIKVDEKLGTRYEHFGVIQNG